RHTRFSRDWSSDVCSSDLGKMAMADVASPTLKPYNDIPVLDWEAFDGEGVTSYDVFRDLRAKTPLVRVPMGMGSMILSLRARNEIGRASRRGRAENARRHA